MITQKKHEKQTVRVGGKLQEDLQTLEQQTPFTYSEIARKAVRKYRRLRPDLSTITSDSTYQGTVLRFELEFKINADDLRKILTWYISLLDLSKPFYTVTEIPEVVARIIAYSSS